MKWVPERWDRVMVTEHWRPRYSLMTAPTISALLETLGRKVPEARVSETVSEPLFTPSLYAYLAMSVIIIVFNHKAIYSYYNTATSFS